MGDVDISKGKEFRVTIEILRDVIAGEVGTKEQTEDLKEKAPETVREHIKGSSVFNKVDSNVVLEEKHLVGHLHARAKGFGLSRKRIGGIGFITMIKRGVMLMDPYIILGPEDEVKPKFSPAPRGKGFKATEKIRPGEVTFKVKILNKQFVPYFKKLMQEGYLGARTSQGYGFFKLQELKPVE